MNDDVNSASVNELATEEIKKSESDVCKQSSEGQRDEVEELVKKLKKTRDKIEKEIDKQINKGIFVCESRQISRNVHTY